MFRVTVLASPVVLATTLLPVTAEESARLTPREKIYIHAVALMIQDSSNAKGLYKAAVKSADHKKTSWKSSDAPLIKNLASLEDDPKLRERYRASLKKRLGDDPKVNGQKLIDEIEKNYSRKRVAIYREELEKTKGKSISPDTNPWPLCLKFPPCPDD